MNDDEKPTPPEPFRANPNRIGDGLSPLAAGDQGSAVEKDGTMRAPVVTDGAWSPPGWLPFAALFVTGAFGSVAAATTGVVATVFAALAAGGTMLMGYWGMRSSGVRK